METREFYIGVRSCEGKPEDDIYMGSMCGWKRQENFNKDNHIKEVINSYHTREEANEAEYELIELMIDDPLNRNYHNTKAFCTAGQPLSDDHKRKLRKPKTAEHKRKLRKPKTAEHKRKLSETRKGRYTGSENHFYGKTHTEPVLNILRKPKTIEHKRKLSESLVNREKLQCTHCRKLVDPANYARWHGDKCKHLKRTYDL